MARIHIDWILRGIALTSSAHALHAQASDLHVRADAFGYRPADTKVALLREPVTGYDAPAPFTPGVTIELRRSSDNAVVFSGARTAWNGGAVHADSGDRVWRFDFTSVQTPGSYYVFDPATSVRSEDLRIGDDVYDDALRQAVRSYYYQRCGVPKLAAYAGANWSDGACHPGNASCRSILTPNDAGSARNLAGGWHDAGDYNKYVLYSCNALEGLLAGYLAAPCAWRDDYGLPDSGNGLPDLLDEVHFELSWLLSMQNVDGSVLHKRSVPNYNGSSPPSGDTPLQYYGPASSGATIVAAQSFAHAAWVWRTLPGAANQAFANQLQSAAVQAWSWLVANPAQIGVAYSNQGFTTDPADPSANDKLIRRCAAASWLLRLTGDAQYRAFFDANYAQSEMFTSFFLNPFAWENTTALLDYTDAPGATPTVRAAIRARFLQLVAGGGHYAEIQNETDAYRAYLPTWAYTWGSNRTKCMQGLLFASVERYAIDPPNADNYRRAAQRYVHYVHGVNPTGFTYLTNMGAFGAAQSVTQFYHGWFNDGTPWDEVGVSLFGPPPGFLPGGPNPSYAPDPAWTGGPIVPPQNQPAQKSYRDWNADWPQASYQVTENHIPYQAAYINLLGSFASRSSGLAGIPCTDGGAASEFCYGDGSASACPCGNSGSFAHGCANSAVSSGARLSASGTLRISADTLVLAASGTPNAAGLYFQGDAQNGGSLGVPFGDGLLCVSGTVVRLGTVIASGNASTYPSGAAPPNNVPVSVKGLVTAGQTRHYQLWYRNAAASFCPPATFNYTNALTAVWVP